MASPDPLRLSIATEANTPVAHPSKLENFFGFDRFRYSTANAVHDFDFLFFKNLDSEIVFCDIGANHGQSVNSLRLLNSVAEVHSFEINPVLYPQLSENGLNYGGKFTLHKYGIGASDCEVDLFLPVFEGQICDTLGSMSLQELQNNNVKNHLEGMAKSTDSSFWGVIKTKCVIKNFDNLNLMPDIVKIDVEGSELKVLHGMKETLSKCHPILLIENSDPASFSQFLAKIGYMAMNYDHATNRFYMGIGNRGNNTFYFHTEKIIELFNTGQAVYSSYAHAQTVDVSFMPLKLYAERLQDAPTREDVRHALRTFFGFDPNTNQIDMHMKHKTRRDLRNELMKFLVGII